EQKTMPKHTLKLDDDELAAVERALRYTTAKENCSDDDYVQLLSVIGQIAKLKAEKAQREKTVRLPRSKEDLAREALIAHIEDVLFNPACRSEVAKDFRERFLGGREKEAPRLKEDMLRDAKKFPEPTDEEWEFEGECPDY